MLKYLWYLKPQEWVHTGTYSQSYLGFILVLEYGKHLKLGNNQQTKRMNTNIMINYEQGEYLFLCFHNWPNGYTTSNLLGLIDDPVRFFRLRIEHTREAHSGSATLHYNGRIVLPYCIPQSAAILCENKFSSCCFLAEVNYTAVSSIKYVYHIVSR